MLYTILVLVLLSMILSFSSVQTAIAGKVTGMVNKNFGTDINIEKVDLSSMRNVVLKNVLIRDHHKDSLIFVHKLSTSILNYFEITENNFELGELDLDDGFLKMRTYKGEDINNLTYFIDRFNKDTTPTSDNAFRLFTESIKLDNIGYYLYDENRSEEPIVFYKSLTGFFNNFLLIGSKITTEIRELSFEDDHKLKVTKLDTDYLYSKEKMELHNTLLETDDSSIEAQIDFVYKDGDFLDFNNKVQIDAVFTKADVALTDIKKFSAELGEYDKFHFTTHFTGTINNFILKDLDLVSDKKARIKGDVTLKNVVDNENFSMDARLSGLSTSYRQIIALLPALRKKLPKELKEFGNFNGSGIFHIDKKNIAADIRANSKLGKLDADVVLNNFDHINDATYKGNIEFKDFKIGKFAKDSLIGEISMVAEVEGKGFSLDSMDTAVKGDISKYEYKGYTYTNIKVNGKIRKEQFNGKLQINDPNIVLFFNGIADLSADRNIFNFRSNVVYANFNKLNLYKKDEESILRGRISMNFTGNNFNNLLGKISIKKASYVNQNDTYFFDDFTIIATKEDSVRVLSIDSPDIVDGKITGNYRYQDILKIAKNALGSTFTNYKKDKVTPGQYIEFNFNIYNKIIEVFLPEVIVGANTKIKGEIISDEDEIKLSLKSPRIEAYKNVVENIRLQIDNTNPLYNLLLSVDKIDTKYYSASELNMVSINLNDTLFVRTDLLGGKNKTEKFDLSFYHTINENNQSVVGIKKSEISFKNNDWLINSKNNHQNKVVFDDNFKTFAIDNVDIISGNQRVDLAGAMHGDVSKSIDLKFKDVNLNAITPVIDSLKLDGKLNGEINIKKVDGQTLPFADLTLNYFSINDEFYGDFKLNASADKSIRDYIFNAELVNSDLKTFETKGRINFDLEDPIIAAWLTFDKFDLGAFAPLGKDVLRDIRGLASGKAVISGKLENPSIKGELDLKNAGMAVPYLNVDYDFSDDAKILLYGQTFDFQSIGITDVAEKTQGVISGKIMHEKFSNWSLDLKISTDNLLVLNTEDSDDAVYYGTAFIEGKTTLKGPTDNLVIDVKAKTNKGTEFVIPISYISTVGESNLIHFVDPAEEEKKKEQGNQELIFEELKGLSMNFDLEVTKDAVAEVVIDKQSGSLLRGSGNGNLKLNIDTNGKFEMFGEFVIDNGEYKFKNIVSRDFIVQKGGTIIWNGNPLDAELNIEAVYHTKANPAVILDEIASTRKIDVDLMTNITGTLSEAQFGFDIEIPNSSSLVSSELEFKLSNEDVMLTQFISLLATGSFMSIDSGNSNFNGSAAIAGTLAEKSSEILSNILKSGNDDFQVGVSYEAGVKNKVDDVQTNDQVGIMVSGRIGDKVIVNGKVGVPVGSRTTSSVVGEVEVILPLNEPETLQAKIYNRQNEVQFDIVDSEGYTQGLGISYLINFDTSREFFEKVGLRKTEEEKNMTKEQRDSVKQAHKVFKRENRAEKKKEKEEKKKITE